MTICHLPTTNSLPSQTPRRPTQPVPVRKDCPFGNSAPPEGPGRSRPEAERSDALGGPDIPENYKLPFAIYQLQIPCLRKHHGVRLSRCPSGRTAPSGTVPLRKDPEGAVRKRNVPMRSADPTFLKITNYHLPFTNYKFLAFANTTASDSASARPEGLPFRNSARPEGPGRSCPEAETFRCAGGPDIPENYKLPFAI